MMVIFTSTTRVPAFTVPEGMEVKLHAGEWWTLEHYSSTEIRVKSMTTRMLFDVPISEFTSKMERVQ
jgi:hypothetical protein